MSRACVRQRMRVPRAHSHANLDARVGKRSPTEAPAPPRARMREHPRWCYLGGLTCPAHQKMFQSSSGSSTRAKPCSRRMT
eukprot:scaffold13227_cov117-Isochrysis_galbana.AAC.7